MSQLMSLCYSPSSPCSLLRAHWHHGTRPATTAAGQGLFAAVAPPERVTSLRLGSSNLSGRLSPILGNLSFLKILDLRDNNLVGQIPPELGRLSRLQVLNLSINSLQGGILH